MLSKWPYEWRCHCKWISFLAENLPCTVIISQSETLYLSELFFQLQRTIHLLGFSVQINSKNLKERVKWACGWLQREELELLNRKLPCNTCQSTGMLQVLLWQPGSRHVTVVLSICASWVFYYEYSRVWLFDTSCAWCKRTCCTLSFWEEQLSWVFVFCSPLERQYFCSRWHCVGGNVTTAHWLQMQHGHLQALGNLFRPSQCWVTMPP